MRSELKELSLHKGYKLLLALFQQQEELAKNRQLTVDSNLPAADYKGEVLRLRGQAEAWARAQVLLDEKLSS
jgi:hypothetical protein